MGTPLQSRIVSQRFDSPWGAFEFAELIPHSLLQGLVRQIFYVRGDMAYQRERILPEGDVVLLFNLGPRQGLVDDEQPDRVTSFEGAFVSGLQRRYVVVEATEGSHMMGVRLWPLGGFRLLGLPMSELADQVVELGWIKRGLDDLAEELASLPTVDARFERIERCLLDWLMRGAPPLPLVAEALARLVRTGGRQRLGVLCRELGVSPRHLNVRFTEQVGINPKGYAKLVRFNRALQQLMAGRRVLTDVALDCGYYDQSHFNLEFRRMSGASPLEYLAHAGPDGSSIVLD